MLAANSRASQPCLVHILKQKRTCAANPRFDPVPGEAISFVIVAPLLRLGLQPRRVFVEREVLLITTMSDGFRTEILTLIQERHVIRPFDTLMYGTGYDCLPARIGNWYNRAYVCELGRVAANEAEQNMCPEPG